MRIQLFWLLSWCEKIMYFMWVSNIIKICLRIIMWGCNSGMDFHYIIVSVFPFIPSQWYQMWGCWADFSLFQSTCKCLQWDIAPLEYVPRRVSPCAGIQAPVPRHVLGSLVKHVQEQSHVQEQNEAGSASRVRHEVGGRTSLCKCMEQIWFG